MRILAALALSLVAVTAAPAAGPVLVVHGGAGTISREEIGAEREALIRAELTRALREGHGILTKGGSSLDAVTLAVTVLEDSPWFNAGKGAVFTADGKNELDAAIMDGATRRAGAVAGLRRIKNPILLARAVMEKSVHVMMMGSGAEAFAKSLGFEFVDPKYFWTEERWKQLEQAREQEKRNPRAALPVRAYFGTVGAVALDRAGRLAAATSTGGMTNKRWGRVGDAPIIGAGTYADANCAVSGTGWGEFYIRAVIAHDICARVAYGGVTLAQAADTVIMKVLPELGGNGGVIALTANGEFATPYNSGGMYRGSIDADGRITVAIWQD